jgi:hypothetical protein
MRHGWRAMGVLVALALVAITTSGPPAGGAPACPFDVEPQFEGTVPPPEDVLGFRLGEREVTVDETYAYLDAADAASDRVTTGKYGTSVEGRALPYAMVGTPENLAPDRLEEIRQAILRIRDPQTPATEVSQLAGATPPFLYIAANVHGNEESGTDASLEFLFELADRSDCAADRIRNEAVVILLPMQNPDGREADTRRNAYGFDMNRDGFARTQPEIDSRTEFLRRYPPLVFVDAHEFGYYRSFFVPNDDPVYHDAPDTVLTWMNDLYAPALAREFDERGWGYFNYGGYDFFMPGYGDTVPADGFMAAGFTLEHYNDAPLHRRLAKTRIQYWLLLTIAARNRVQLLEEQHSAYVDAVDQGAAGVLDRNELSNPESRLLQQVPERRVRHYFILDQTPRAFEIALLVRRLQRMDVEVYRLDAPLQVEDFRPYKDPVERRTLPAGTYWIPMAQPQKHWIQLMLNEDTYVPVRETFDVTGWSNPLLMNLDGGSSGRRLSPQATLVPPMDEPAWSEAPPSQPTVGVMPLSKAVYAFEGVGNLRWLMDTVWEVPYEVIRPQDVAHGALDAIDVLVVPSGGFVVGRRNLGPAGVRTLVDWVRDGGRYVGYKFGGALLAEHIALTTARFKNSPYSVDGTLIRTRVNPSSPLAAGVGSDVWVMFENDDTIKIQPSLSPLRYPKADAFDTSGLAAGTYKLVGEAASVDEPFGDGRVVLFPFDMNFRGMTQGTQRILWNAIYGPDP